MRNRHGKQEWTGRALAGTRNIAEVSTHDHACSMVAVAVGVTGQAARDIGDWWRTIVAEASETQKTWP